MIQLTTTQAKNYGVFSQAVITEISETEYSVTLQNGSVSYQIVDSLGKKRLYKSLSSAATFAKSCGVSSAQIIF